MSTARLLLVAMLASAITAASAAAQPVRKPGKTTQARKKARAAKRAPATVQISASGLIEVEDEQPSSRAHASKGFDLAARERLVTARVREAPVDDQRLGDAEIKKVIRSRREEVDNCHARIADRGDAPREVAVEFLIDPSGAVSRVTADADGPNSGRLEQCMVRAVKRWRFRATASATPMEVPFVFSDVTEVE